MESKTETLSNSSNAKRRKLDSNVEDTENDGKQRTLVLITGASRGFGKALAVGCARRFHQATDYILIARNNEDLKQCKQKLEEIMKERFGEHGISEISTVCADLGDLTSVELTIGQLFDEIEEKGYSRGILFNNAAVVGPLGPIQEIGDLKSIESGLDFSITSSLWLAARFVRIFGSQVKNSTKGEIQKTPEEGLPSVIVNVSSHAAVNPSASMVVYCAGKAARQMAMRTIAKEQDPHKLKVLNYGPGPLDTYMQEKVRTDQNLLKSRREMFVALRDNGRLVNPEVSAVKCIEMIAENAFESGCCFDFYW